MIGTNGEAIGDKFGLVRSPRGGRAAPVSSESISKKPSVRHANRTPSSSESFTGVLLFPIAIYAQTRCEKTFAALYGNPSTTASRVGVIKRRRHETNRVITNSCIK